MRAAVYHGPGDLRVEERERPEIGPDEALLRVSHCGICGTDHRIVAGKHRLVPAGAMRVLGHEIVGEIVEVGSDVRPGLPTGPVIVAPNTGCGHCRECRVGQRQPLYRSSRAGHYRRRRLRGISEDTRCGRRARQCHSAGSRHRPARRRTDRAARLRASRAGASGHRAGRQRARRRRRADRHPACDAGADERSGEDHDRRPLAGAAGARRAPRRRRSRSMFVGGTSPRPRGRTPADAASM